MVFQKRFHRVRGPESSSFPSTSCFVEIHRPPAVMFSLALNFFSLCPCPGSPKALCISLFPHTELINFDNIQVSLTAASRSYRLVSTDEHLPKLLTKLDKMSDQSS